MTVDYLTKALTACEQALEHQPINQPDFASACRIVGNVFQGMGYFEEASIWHSRALEDNHDLQEIYYNIANIYLHLENWEHAVHAYERTLDFDPNLAEVHWYLAQIKSYLGDEQGELENWWHSVNLIPDRADHKMYNRLGHSFWKQGQGERAIFCFQRALELKPDFADVYSILAKILISQGKQKEAIACYEDLLVHEPDLVWVHHKIGMVKLDQGDINAAIAKFRECIQLDPKYPWAYRSLVTALLKQSEWEKAILTCRGIISLVEDYPWVYSQMAQALLKTDRREEAIACYQKVCQLRGWSTCQEHNYHFTNDTLSNSISIWTEILGPFTGMEGLKALEISCFQGMATCWLLDQVVNSPSSQLTCVDQTFSPEFKDNLVKTTAEDRVEILAGDIEQILASLPVETYQLIKVQHSLRKPSHVQCYGHLSWRLLAIGGIMILPDYRWKNSGQTPQSTQRGIDAFLDSVEGKFELLHRDQDVIIRKVHE